MASVHSNLMVGVGEGCTPLRMASDAGGRNVMWRAGNRGARRDTAGVVIAIVVLFMAGACGGSAGAPTSTPSASPPRASTSAPSPVDRAAPALAAYTGMWQDFVQAGTTSDWKSPNLAHHAIGVALTNLSRALYADYRNGFVTRGQPRLHPGVQSTEPSSGDPTKVIVADCADTNEWLKYYARTGKPVGGGGGRSRITGIVEKQPNGSWKVSDYAVQDLGSCG